MITRRQSFLTLAAFLSLVMGMSGQEANRFTLADREDIDEMFEDYSRSFGERNYVELREHLQVPFLSFPDEPVVFEELDEVITLYANLRQALDDRDYGHSKIIETRITALSPHRALVNKTYQRFKTDGALLEERAFLYIVSKNTGKWKICGILEQDLSNFGKMF